MKNLTLNKITKYIFIVLTVLMIAIPLHYWYLNPKITIMEIFKEFWIQYLLVAVFCFIIVILDSEEISDKTR